MILNTSSQNQRPLEVCSLNVASKMHELTWINTSLSYQTLMQRHEDSCRRIVHRQERVAWFSRTLWSSLGLMATGSRWIWAANSKRKGTARASSQLEVGTQLSESSVLCWWHLQPWCSVSAHW